MEDQQGKTVLTLICRDSSTECIPNYKIWREGLPIRSRIAGSPNRSAADRGVKGRTDRMLFPPKKKNKGANNSARMSNHGNNGVHEVPAESPLGGG